MSSFREGNLMERSFVPLMEFDSKFCKWVGNHQLRQNLSLNFGDQTCKQLAKTLTIGKAVPQTPSANRFDPKGLREVVDFTYHGYVWYSVLSIP